MSNSILVEHCIIIRPVSEYRKETGNVVDAQQFDVLFDHSLGMSDGCIDFIGSECPDPSSYAQRIDCSGMVVMPGFINAHTHLYSAFARGIPGVEPSRDFQNILEHLWWRLDRTLTVEDCRFAALSGCIDAVRHGVTTLFDHHASPTAIEGSLDAIAEAVGSTGIRACLCYEVSDRDGVPTALAGIEENSNWIRRCSTEGSPLYRAMVGLHAAFTLSDVTIDRAARMAREAGVGCHIHLAEDAFDQDASIHRHACRVTERLNRLGVLGPGCIAAHGVHLSLDELLLLRNTETMLVHNPQSNMNNAVGIANLGAMKTAGIRVGLGTDAMSTNMLEELRTAILAQRYRSMDPSAGFDEPVTALFAGNAAIAGRTWGLWLGRIEPGAPADLAIIPYDPPTPLTPDNASAHIVFGISQRAVSTTIVHGRIVMLNGKLAADIDEERVQARCRELAASLWKRW